MVQQPRAPVRNDCGFADSARWTPVTSWPASAARAAATAESTPPDMAASTRRGRGRCEVSSHSPSRVRGRREPGAREYPLLADMEETQARRDTARGLSRDVPQQSRSEGLARASAGRRPADRAARAAASAGRWPPSPRRVLARGELGHLWWRLPGVSKPRKEGDGRLPGRPVGGGLGGELADGGPARRLRRGPGDHPCHAGQLRERGEGLPGPGPRSGGALHRPRGRADHADDPRAGRGVPRGQPGVQRAERRDRARGLRGAARGLHGRDVRGLGAADGGVCARYGIPVDREHIIGHVEVPGTDHTDPGPGWDWKKYLRLVEEATKAPA